MENFSSLFSLRSYNIDWDAPVLDDSDFDASFLFAEREESSAPQMVSSGQGSSLDLVCRVPLNGERDIR